MNTLPKSLTIAFLAVSIFILGLNVDLVGAQVTSAGTAETQRAADPVLSRYLRFDRLTTGNGLSRFDPRTDSFRNYIDKFLRLVQG